MKSVEFLGDSLDHSCVSRSPRHDIGFQLERVQRGLDPDDWKPVKSIGQVSGKFACATRLEHIE
jgi:phage-related protein